MNSNHALLLLIRLLIQFVLCSQVPLPFLAPTRLLSPAEEAICDNIKCFGQNECTLVHTFCNLTVPTDCPLQPLCTTSPY
ncbi:unnamed protein product [Caenorhabditis nigoni]